VGGEGCQNFGLLGLRDLEVPGVVNQRD
jgi:hypothetical protein